MRELHTVLEASLRGAVLLILSGARDCSGHERTLWQICGFLFLVVNTHLYSHALIFTVGRYLAHAQGWYEDRRQVQTVAAIGLAIVVGLILLIAVTRSCTASCAIRC